MLVIVSVPNAPVIVWPTAVTTVSPMVTVAGPSGAVKANVPLANSPLVAAAEPAGSPASSTWVEPGVPATGIVSVVPLSAMVMTRLALARSPSPSRTV